MSFNVVNLKHRDTNEVWLHICHAPVQDTDSDGKPMFKPEKKELKAYQFANLAAQNRDHEFELIYDEDKIDALIHDGMTDTIVGYLISHTPVMISKPMYSDEEKKKPVRIKFKSVHSDAFRKAFFKMNVRLAQLKDGKQKQYEELAKEKAEISHDEVVADITKAFLDAEDLAIDMITELSIDWEGFTDQDGNNLEFKPEYLRFVISQVENYHVLQQIRDAFKNAEDFMEA